MQRHRGQAAAADVEAITRLKARYCRYLDTKDWAAWRTVFADDFTSDLAGADGKNVVDVDEFITYTRRTIGRPSQPTVHQVHAPEITLLSATTARGVWALNDVVRLLPAVTLRGYGHYHETYAKEGGQWRITSSVLTRLREDIATPLLTFPGATRLRIAAAKMARRTSDLRHSEETD